MKLCVAFLGFSACTQLDPEGGCWLCHMMIAIHVMSQMLSQELQLVLVQHV